MIDRVRPVLVTGAGGFIGGHLAAALAADGVAVRAVDVKPVAEWYQRIPGVEEVVADLSTPEACESAVDGVGTVYSLAADMGGMGFIAAHKIECMRSVLITTHLLEAASLAGVERFFFASSACVYAEEHQDHPDVRPLIESDAYPAMPEDGYGWEKLFSERMCRHYLEERGLETRVGRYHNVYGAYGAWTGGREKAPAAICRKVAASALTGDHMIEIWGDGKQTRSFTYIDDCVVGTRLVTDGAWSDPVNIGSSELVTINELVDLVADIAGVELERRHDLSQPQGVRGRNSDNTLIRERYGWEPSTSLRQGLAQTYAWVHQQVAQELAAR